MPELFTQRLELKALHFHISLTPRPFPSPRIPVSILMRRHNPSNKVSCKSKESWFSSLTLTLLFSFDFFRFLRRSWIHIRCFTGSGRSHRFKVLQTPAPLWSFFTRDLRVTHALSSSKVRREFEAWLPFHLRGFHKHFTVIWLDIFASLFRTESL